MARVTLLALSVVVSALLLGCVSTAPGSTYHPPPGRAPSPPSGLSAKAISFDRIVLHWVDNSDNEEGFHIYRDGLRIDSVGPNITTFTDRDLKFGTTYSYCVSAYNQFGESSRTLSGEIKTPNPPIKVTLRKVGVYENGEAPLREVLDPKGEIYLYVVVEDGKAQEPKPLRVPYQDYYHLKDNEITDVDMEVFYTQEVGNYLHVFVSAWENDGGGFEQLVQRAIGTAIIETATGGTGIGALFGDVLGNLVGKFLGSEDDHIGDYEQVWYPGKCWGAGEHCVERGNLRLWFDISSPAFTKAAPTCTSMPRETPTSPAPAPIVPFPEPSPATISVTPAPAPVVPSSPSVVPSSITVTLDSVFIKDDHDPIGKGEVYFLVALASEDGRVGVWRRIPSDGHFSVASGAVICLPAPGNLLRFSADSRNYGLYIGVWEEDHHECSRSKLATWMRQRQGEFWPQLLDATTKLSQCGDDLIGQVSKVVGLNNIGRHTSLVGDCEVNYTVSIKPQ